MAEERLIMLTVILASVHDRPKIRDTLSLYADKQKMKDRFYFRGRHEVLLPSFFSDEILQGIRADQIIVINSCDTEQRVKDWIKLQELAYGTEVKDTDNLYEFMRKIFMGYAEQSAERVVVKDFGWAIQQLKAGKKVTRPDWNGKGMYLGLQVPDAHSANTLPYIYMFTAQGRRIPWVASHSDILSESWEIV